MISLVINGRDVRLDSQTTILEFLVFKVLKPQAVVVERNGEIVPRERYGDVVLDEGDTVEIVQMMAGG
ncbi:MAG TPA: sulfur carrier protein ThiS [Thermoanaerobaculia bacterium]|nr:sulfur carrier protein ThiS [Thermoanaerobaculia bacterium]